MAKYLKQANDVPASEIGLEDSKPISKNIDFAAVDTVDTLPDLRRLHSDTSEANSVSSEIDLQHEINRSMMDATHIQEWSPNDYEMVKTLQLAPRNQGRVDLMKSLQTGRFAAVKRMPNTWITSGPKEFDSAYPESNERPWFDIGIIKYLHDSGFDHVCEPWGVFSDGLDTYVVSSYASGGELFSWLDRDPTPGLEREAIIRPIMSQLFSAVRWLHDLGVAHRDISLENVLLTEGDAGPRVKLIDFGMATIDRTSTAACGKKSYMAPEIYSTAPFDVFPTDAFALGVVLFSVCCREYPWNSTKAGTCKIFDYVYKNGLHNFMQRRKVYGSKQQRLAEVISRPLQTLLVGLLQMTPNTRMTLGTHPKKRVTLSEVQADGEQPPSVWSDSDWFKAAD